MLSTGEILIFVRNQTKPHLKRIFPIVNYEAGMNAIIKPKQGWRKVIIFLSHYPCGKQAKLIPFAITLNDKVVNLLDK